MARKPGIAHRLYTGEISYDFVGHRKIWYIISGVLLVVSIISIVTRGLSLGIEFRGGVDFQAPVTVTATTKDDVLHAVQGTGLKLGEITVTTIGSRTVQVETPALTDDQVTTVQGAIAKQVNIAADSINYSRIGASWGQQITNQAIIALVVFLVLVMCLIWIYFRDFKMSLAAIIALIHDLVITVGFYALIGFTVTSATVIGVLTILGYSLYDTVVVFDKIRENVRDLMRQKFTFSQGANLAVNQVLVRSINTTVTGVLPVAALLFAGSVILGTGPLEDLGLALFVGMVIGAYSSIFIATPLLSQMRELEPEMREHRERLARRAARAAQRHPESATLVAVGADASADVDALEFSTDVVESTEPEDVGWVSASDMVTPMTRNQPARQSRSQRKK